MLLIVKSLVNVIVENQEYFLRAPSPTITSKLYSFLYQISFIQSSRDIQDDNSYCSTLHAKKNLFTFVYITPKNDAKCSYKHLSVYEVQLFALWGIFCFDFVLSNLQEILTMISCISKQAHRRFVVDPVALWMISGVSRI